MLQTHQHLLPCLDVVRAQATKTYYNSRDEVLQLWCHETCRIIADRMWDASDKEWLRKQLDEKLQVTKGGGGVTGMCMQTRHC
jgi:hypothetical protein